MTKPTLDLRHLSIEERLHLIEQIWDSIVEETEGDPDAFPLTEKQRAELERRIVEHDRDPQSAIPWDEAVGRIRGELRRNREELRS